MGPAFEFEMTSRPAWAKVAVQQGAGAEPSATRESHTLSRKEEGGGGGRSPWEVFLSLHLNALKKYRHTTRPPIAQTTRSPEVAGPKAPCIDSILLNHNIVPHDPATTVTHAKKYCCVLIYDSYVSYRSRLKKTESRAADGLSFAKRDGSPSQIKRTSLASAHHLF